MLKTDEDSFGVIVVDGNGALFARLDNGGGRSTTVLHKFSVNLPNQHRRGGFSANRYQRGVEIARHAYLRKVAEKTTELFIVDGSSVGVAGLVLAGSADFKNDLHDSDLFDPRLKSKVLKVVGCAEGQERGLEQAVAASQDALGGLRFVREKKLLEDFFLQVDDQQGKAAYGLKDLVTALDMRAIETVVLFEDLTIKMSDPLLLDIIDAEDLANLVDQEVLLTEWMVENCRKQFGAELVLVSDATEEGTKFVGFGGVGGLLRWPVDFQMLNEVADANGQEDAE